MCLSPVPARCCFYSCSFVVPSEARSLALPAAFFSQGGLALWVFCVSIQIIRDFPGSPMVKTSLCSAGGVGLIPAWGA